MAHPSLQGLHGGIALPCWRSVTRCCGSGGNIPHTDEFVLHTDESLKDSAAEQGSVQAVHPTPSVAFNRKGGVRSPPPNPSDIGWKGDNYSQRQLCNLGRPLNSSQS